jgi:trimeric autotransporter adhesin
MRNALLLAVLVGLAVTAVAQTLPPTISLQPNTIARPMISQPVDESQLVRLKGNTHPLARPVFDIGGAPPNLQLERMLLVLKRSPEQDATLLTLLDQQQDKSSPNFHRWLTPDQFGQLFGPTDADIQTVTGWLQTHGFQIAHVSRGRTMVEFSGTHAQLQQAFHTSIHQYAVNGELHWANASDPMIPAALAPVVAGIHTLHNFLKKPDLIMTNQRFFITRSPGPKPQINGGGGQHFLGPGDFGVIYNTTAAGVDGTGATIAVIGRSNINTGDVADFRNLFGLSANLPQVILNGPDPTDLGGGEEVEAVLDNTWSGAVAPGATIKFVVSATTVGAGPVLTDGVDLSELYIVDNNLADIMTESFGTCEQNVTTTEAAGIAGLAEQAAAQGITYMVSTGDTGAAGCANSTTVGTASVSVLASTPFDVAVGGTMFNDTANPAKFWGPGTGLATTALSYIPENVWNETTSATNLASTGGGKSVLFSKPSWQAPPATPNDTARDIPDVSLAAAGHTPYLICVAGSCSSQGFLAGVAGTSASAPSFAGIMALVVQKTGSRQGNANFVLYKLAASQSSLTTCNGSSTTTLPASNCIFNDVTSGNNSVPGVTGFTAKAGYDAATGLGSVNVTNLVNNWNSAAGAGSFKGTVTTLALNGGTAVNVTHGASVPVSITVAPSGTGTGTPTGDVALVASTTTNQSIEAFTLTTNPLTGSTTLLPGGTYTVTARYAGDGIFASSTSNAVPVVVSAETSNVTLHVLDINNNFATLTTAVYGNPVYLRADVAGTSGKGIPTGQITFNDTAGTVPGNPYTLASDGDATTAIGLFALPAGAHSVTAHYGGDASFQTSTSGAAAFTVTKAPTTSAVQSSSTNVSLGSSVTLTANISTTSNGNAPSGTITFFSGTTQIGAPVTVTGTNGFGNIQNGAGTLASATVQMSTTALPAGADSITATYNGDNNYSTSTSSATTVNVANFALATSPSPVTVTIASPGGSGTATINVTGLAANFNGSVTFACSGLPAQSTCTFNPATVTGNGTTAVPTTVMVKTTAPSRAALLKHPAYFAWWTATGGGLMAGIFLIGVPVRRRRWMSLAGLAAFALLLTIAGCGGGSKGPPPITNPGTPVSTSNVTVTGTSSTGGVATTTFTLVVQ